jgi:hypothetical protein
MAPLAPLRKRTQLGTTAPSTIGSGSEGAETGDRPLSLTPDTDAESQRPRKRRRSAPRKGADRASDASVVDGSLEVLAELRREREVEGLLRESLLLGLRVPLRLQVVQDPVDQVLRDRGAAGDADGVCAL